MQKITPPQLRAARALLNWSRVDLAKHAGISEPTIHRFENGVNEPEVRTVEKLLDVFDKHGVEFSDNQGVRFKPKSIEIFDGIERFQDFYEYIYQHLEQHGGDLCANIYDETSLVRHRKDPETHRKRLKSLVDRGDVSVRVLTTISDFKTYGYCQFRWQPDQPPIPTGFYAFGDCLALISFVNEESPYIVVMHSGPLAEAYRQGFNILWKHAKPPPVVKKP